MKRQLVCGSLVIDLRADVKMTAVISLMDSLIMCYAYADEVIWYSDGRGNHIKGQDAIRSYALKMIENEELPF